MQQLQIESKSSNLFKNILLSFFPKNIDIFPSGNWIQATSMFISFVSAKQFYWVVNKKIGENYKLNMFDITLDPFDVKIWFWEKPNIKIKNLDTYYSYCCVANMLWNKFYNPNIIAIQLSTMTLAYLNKYFKNNKTDNLLLSQLWLTTYFLTFIFYSRFKIFPFNKENQKENFNRFIELFFELYKYLFSITNVKISNKKMIELKKNIFEQNWLFFTLFHIYQLINWIFEDNIFRKNKTKKIEFYERLFSKNIQKEQKTIINDYLKNLDKYTTSTQRSTTEKILMYSLFPIDFFIKYMLNSNEIYLTSRTICAKLFVNDKIKKYLKQSIKSDKKIKELLSYILGKDFFKKYFFEWVKDFLFKKFRTDTDYNYEQEQELNEFLSAVWEIEWKEKMWFVPANLIPKKIREESGFIETFINYYINVLWWLSIARWSGWYLHIFKKELLDQIIDNKFLNWNSKFEDKKTKYFGKIAFLFTQNTYFYHYAYSSVKIWKEIFQMPINSNIENITFNSNNLYNLLKTSFDCLLSDISETEIKTYVNNKTINNLFKERFSNIISNFLHSSKDKQINQIYENTINLIWNNKTKKTKILNLLIKNFNDKEMHNLKLKTYSFDFWITQELFWKLLEKKIFIYQDPSVILHQLSTLKDTFFWLCLYITYIVTQNTKFEQQKVRFLIDLYIKDIISNFDNINWFFEIILWIIDKYKQLFVNRLKLDNNKFFLQFWLNNLNKFYEEHKKEIETITLKITWEDILRYKSYLKNITYYNKRFLIPNINKTKE